MFVRFSSGCLSSALDCLTLSFDVLRVSLCLVWYCLCICLDCLRCSSDVLHMWSSCSLCVIHSSHSFLVLFSICHPHNLHNLLTFPAFLHSYQDVPHVWYIVSPYLPNCSSIGSPSCIHKFPIVSLNLFMHCTRVLNMLSTFIHGFQYVPDRFSIWWPSCSS